MAQTVNELQVRLAQAIAELDAIKAQMLPTATDWIALLNKASALNAEVAGIPALIAQARQIENAGAIGTCKATVATTIRAQIAALELDKLMGHPVNRVIWIAGEDAEGDIVSLLESRTTVKKLKTANAEGAGKAQKGVSGLKPRKIYSNGTEVIEGDKPFVLRFGTDAQKAIKHPHKNAAAVLELLSKQGWKLTQKPPTDTSSAAIGLNDKAV